MTADARPTVAVYSFTSCEGCSLAILECEDGLLDLVGNVRLVNWREAMDPIEQTFDIAFVDGSITTEHEIDEIKDLRARAGILVALGACATHGCVNINRNNIPLARAKEIVYGIDGDAPEFDSLPEAQPLANFVDVDVELFGCPIDRTEFLQLVGSVLIGAAWSPPDHPVCVECKAAGIVCRFHRGEMCLGPLTRAGCGAICPVFGAACDACRGLSPDANLDSFSELAASYGVTESNLTERLQQYGARQEAISE